MNEPLRLKLTAALSKHVAAIAADLRTQMLAAGPVRDRAQRLHADEQVGDAFEVWTDLLSRRAAVLWVLKTVYVRVLEDRGLVTPGRLLDRETQQLFEQLAPNLGDTAFLSWVFRDLGAPRGGLPELFAPQPAEVAQPSDDLSRALISFWRYQDPDTNAVWSFADEHFEGELMGNLYQDLDPIVKDRFALCQTPDFVREFILDRTLTPAMALFGASEVRLLDPACGSGHFLIDGLKRLVAATAENHQDWPKEKVVEHALDRVVGIDLNDYACALARTRLIMTAAELSGVTKLVDAARFHPHVYWADGLEQVEKEEKKLVLQTDLFRQVAEEPRATLTRSDVRVALNAILGGGFAAVVANPPYIVESDDARKMYHRESAGRGPRYKSAYKQYHLSSPFIERCFQLAVSDGFVGLIVDNQFMKKDYGRPLVEEVLSVVDLSLVVDTSRAKIPNHGTPTIILFARNRRPTTTGVRVILSRRAETGVLVEPRKGAMWQGILAAAADASYEDDFVLSREIDCSTLRRHPWSIGDDTSASIVRAIESMPHAKLSSVAAEIGRTTACGHDPVFLLPWHAVRTLRSEQVVLPFVEGSAVRDWAVTPKRAVVYPYAELGGAPLSPADARVPRFLWRYRALLASRTMFGKTIAEHGKVWFEHLEHYGTRIKRRSKIAFSTIATHNHFALTESPALFNSKAPVITLNDDGVAIAPAMVALLNSSLACYWIKERFQPRGATSANRNHPDPERAAYELSVKGMKEFPLVDKVIKSGAIRELGAELIELSTARQMTLSPEYWRAAASSVESLRARLDERWREHDRLRQRQIFLQEEIDWLIYHLCGLTDLAHLSPPNGPRCLPRGQRAFERLLGHRSFVRQNGALLPPEAAECETGGMGLPSGLESVTLGRERAIRENESIARIETYMYKRLWRDTEGNTPEVVFRRDLDHGQLQDAIVAKIEIAAASRGTMFEAGRLAADLMPDSAINVLVEVVEGGASFDLENVVRAALMRCSVPSYPGHVYSRSGLAKHSVWEAAWEQQRATDAGHVGASAQAAPAYSQGGRGKSKDFLRDEYWSQRGAFDVPTERFTAFTEVPGRSGGDTLYGWAGWTSTERVKALLAIDEQCEDQGITLADRIALLDSAWRLLPDVARDDAAIGARLKAELQALVGVDGPAKVLLDDWKQRFPPPGRGRGRAARVVAVAEERDDEDGDDA